MNKLFFVNMCYIFIYATSSRFLKRPQWSLTLLLQALLGFLNFDRYYFFCLPTQGVIDKNAVMFFTFALR